MKGIDTIRQKRFRLYSKILVIEIYRQGLDCTVAMMLELSDKIKLQRKIYTQIFVF